MHSNKMTYHLISICGGSASGKSSIISDLRAIFNENQLCIISFDDYYKPIEYQHKDEKGIHNFDLPDSIDKKELLNDLKQLSLGKTIEKTEYTFNNPNKVPAKKYLYPAPVVIVEGLFVLHFEEISNITDYKIFVEADENIRYSRREKRDLFERGIPKEIFLHQWQYHVKAAYENYLEPYTHTVDLIINNDIDYKKGLQTIITHIEKILKSGR